MVKFPRKESWLMFKSEHDIRENFRQNMQFEVQTSVFVENYFRQNK